ncbi:MAG: hypothetical protein OEZ22_12520 [Spirochaetia bacterium]|nr:hypothetical protein [Spirochaetia bacterium]
MKKIRIYLDEDVKPLLSEIHKGRGYNVIHTNEAGNSGISDIEQMLPTGHNIIQRQSL